MNNGLGFSALFLCFSISVIIGVGLWRLFSAKVPYKDQWAMIYILMLMTGMAINYFWAFLVRNEGTHDMALEHITPVLVARFGLSGIGIFGLIRQWTYRIYGERIWISLAAISAIGTAIIDYMI